MSEERCITKYTELIDRFSVNKLITVRSNHKIILYLNYFNKELGSESC